MTNSLRRPTLKSPASTSTAWLLRLWVVVAVFATSRCVRSLQVGIPLRDPHGEVFLNRVALTVGIFVVLVVLDGAPSYDAPPDRPRCLADRARALDPASAAARGGRCSSPSTSSTSATTT